MGLKQWYSTEKMKKSHIGDMPQSYSQIKITLLGHSTPNGANFCCLDMTHPRVWQKFAKLLQYIRYDNLENFGLILCTD